MEIDWVDSEQITDENAGQMLGHADGIILPGGFGDRGIEGMIAACRYARETTSLLRHLPRDADRRHRIRPQRLRPYWRQLPRVYPENPYCVIDLMPDQQGNLPRRTMRLGRYPCVIKAGSKMFEAYGKAEIGERHRHRYEFNNQFRKQIEDAGLTVSGSSPDGRLVETVEITDRDFYIGVQFHPRVQVPSQPRPSPL